MTTFLYDAAGQLTTVTDPLGNVTAFAYDNNGNRILTSDPLQNNTTSAYNYRGQTTEITDALGARITMAYGGSGCGTCGGGGEKITSLTDQMGSTTSYTYDLRGLLTSITDPLQKITSLTYDANGRPGTKTDRNGTMLTYGFTPTGRPASITYPDNSQVVNTYDNLDRLATVSDSIGTSGYTFDAAGHITDYTDAQGFTLSYAYDAAGNVTHITYPDQSAVVYTYDAANRLLTVTNWLAEQASYTYDQAGRLATFTNFNGIVTTYSYDGASRLTGMGSTVASYQFTLDGNGNRTHSTETEPLSPTLSPGSTVYDYNTQRNRLLSAGPLNYTYDDEGQLATSGAVSYTFDCDHRLIGIGTGTQFTYDGLSNRLRVVRGGVSSRYIYDPYGNLLAEADSNGITRKYIYGRGLLAVAVPDARYCYHFNATGSTIALTDAAQVVVNSYTYEPFGQVLGQQEAVAQPFKYVGQYGVMAEPGGLYYMRARYYDPGVGRFISEDPLGFGGGDVNLSVYVANDPINLVDPFGLEAGTVSKPGIFLPFPVIKLSPRQWEQMKKDLSFPIPPFPITPPRDASPTTRDSVRDPGSEDVNEFCRKEKQKCIEMCAEAIYDCDRGHVTGGSMQECINNCLPEICGGAPKWKGYK